MTTPNLRGLALLSVFAAVVTIGLKGVAYSLTGSAGLLSDAFESAINLLAAITAYFSLWYAARPADPTHTFGHEKIEFFASGLEGGFIVLAGLGTAGYAILHLADPHPLTRLDAGVGLALVATIINLIAGRLLLRAGRRHRSIVLEADGQHLMADVYTTAGVILGLLLVALTGWTILDPLIALAVGLNILVTGFRLIRRSFHGLMDHALPVAQQDELRAVIRAALPPGADFHALRTRQAGRRLFAEFHVLVDGGLSVREAHRIAHDVEERLVREHPDVAATIHIEPIDELTSWEDDELRRLGEVVPLEDPAR